MSDLAASRARHIKDRISRIRLILAGKSLSDAVADPAIWPAFERYLEVISEASKNLPEDWKAQFGPDIPWRQIRALGNLLRHVYDRADPQVLWTIYERDLGPLEAAIDRMLAAHSQS